MFSLTSKVPAPALTNVCGPYVSLCEFLTSVRDSWKDNAGGKFQYVSIAFHQ